MYNNVYQYAVCIECMTYNQSKYILYTLNSFVTQLTDFPYVILLVDDASIDGEQEVIKSYVNEQFDVDDPNVAYEKETEYATIKYAQHKVNKNCYIVILYLKYNHYQKKKQKSPYLESWRQVSKYAAVCEGDDYWTDPLKLQKQVDFMENNSSYGLVHTNFNFVDTENKVIDTPGNSLYRDLKSRISDGFIWDYLLVNPGFILTCTVLYRVDLFIPEERTFYDHGLFLMLSRQSKVHYLEEVTSSYRRNPNSIMMSQPKAVSNKMGLILLYQLYYYYAGNNKTNLYYRRSLRTQFRIIECYANILLRCSKEVMCEYRKLLYVFYKNPCVVLFLPFSMVYVALKKIAR